MPKKKEEPKEEISIDEINAALKAAVDSSSPSDEFYKLSLQLTVRYMISAESDEDRKDYMRLSLALRKELDKKPEENDTDEEAAELDALSDEVQRSL